MKRNAEQVIRDFVQVLAASPLNSHHEELAATFREATDLAAHGEWGIALEVICENLYEYDFPLPGAVFDQIVSLGCSWGMGL